MSDRIKELMKQAGTDCSGKWMGVDHVEKFVELIVQECAQQIVEKGTDWVDFAPSQKAVRPEYWDMAQHIKQHFGVTVSKQEKFSQAVKTAFEGGIDLSGQDTP